MKAIVMHGPRDGELADVDISTPGPHEVLIRTVARASAPPTTVSTRAGRLARCRC
jgi:NADPH:quinone reductase-like Zn-dependent oxidoreductase